MTKSENNIKNKSDNSGASTGSSFWDNPANYGKSYAEKIKERRIYVENYIALKFSSVVFAAKESIEPEWSVQLAKSFTGAIDTNSNNPFQLTMHEREVFWKYNYWNFYAATFTGLGTFGTLLFMKTTVFRGRQIITSSPPLAKKSSSTFLKRISDMFSMKKTSDVSTSDAVKVSSNNASSKVQVPKVKNKFTTPPISAKKAYASLDKSTAVTNATVSDSLGDTFLKTLDKDTTSDEWADLVNRLHLIAISFLSCVAAAFSAVAFSDIERLFYDISKIPLKDANQSDLEEKFQNSFLNQLLPLPEKSKTEVTGNKLASDLTQIMCPQLIKIHDVLLRNYSSSEYNNTFSRDEVITNDISDIPSPREIHNVLKLTSKSEGNYPAQTFYLEYMLQLIHNCRQKQKQIKDEQGLQSQNELS